MYKYKYKYLCKYASMDEGQIRQTEDKWWEGIKPRETIIVQTSADKDRCYSIPITIPNWYLFDKDLRFRVYDNQKNTLPNITFSMRTITRFIGGSTIIDGLWGLRHGIIKRRPTLKKDDFICVGDIENAKGDFKIEIYDRWKTK
jgi:hypothetical protein